MLGFRQSFNILIIATVGCSLVLADPSPPKADTAKKWYREIQKLGASYKKASTQAKTDLLRSKLIEDLKKQFDGRTLQFQTKVREVRWKKGIAEIYTAPEIPFSAKISPRIPLKINRGQPIELDLTQEEAAAIQPGDKLQFTGQLIFHPRKWGAVGRSTKSQQLYSLRHEFLLGGFLGTFTTKKFEVKIKGEKVPCHWAEKEDN